MFATRFAIIAAMLAFALPARAADPAAGEKVFKAQCSACHTVEQGKNRIGPSLFGVVGRTSGSV
ncbi:MAG TPA: c-type cytochrome, partial [Acetobacteraceae bacterium]